MVMKKLFILFYIIFLFVFTGCSCNNEKLSENDYTYNTYTSALGNNWNPHTWETSSDREILDFISTPFVSLGIKDSKESIYQWIYEMATGVEDVTKENQNDIIKYKSSLPEGITDVNLVESGYVYEIKLNKNAKWEDGNNITADDYVYSMQRLLDPKMKNYRANLYVSGESAIAGAYDYYNSHIGNDKDVALKKDDEQIFSFDSVGLYKVDDYTIHYVMAAYQDYNYFLTSLTSNWLVHKDTYENGYNESGKLLTTNYGTSKKTSMSYGPYKISSIQKDKQIILKRNENWYGYTEDENGNLYSIYPALVDGKEIKQYLSTKVVIDVLTEDAAKQKFLNGKLSIWTPSASELSSYNLSDKLYQVDETYTMSLFFNSNVESLKIMDKSKGNKNSIVLSNDKFRKAFSYSINRSEWVKSTQGYKPAYSLLNNLYYYDIYNNPSSVYRKSKQAMEAICSLYNVEYGDNKLYKTLEEAYNSITGYNLTIAKELMNEAANELINKGLYKANEEIVIRIAYSKGALTSDDNAQVALLEKYLNEAIKDSKFGNIKLEAVGNINDRYSDVPNGEFAVGYGAWGGAAFYPFRNFQLYMDPEKNKINELGCWNPVTEKTTISINGKHVTKTYQEWSNSMVGTGEFSDSDFNIKLHITASLEEKFLSFYYRIPLASSTQSFLLSYKIDYYTDEYNIMYDFGGFRLLQFNYNDKKWQEYVDQNNGSLNYK